MKEILTIQVGNFANFIGSHFWNFQDELLGLAEELNGDPAYKNHGLNMDVLYRSGEHQGIPTYTPRLISIEKLDKQFSLVAFVVRVGSLGSLSYSSSYPSQPSTVASEVATWKGNVSTQVAQPLKRNLFLEHLYEGQEKSHNSVNHTSDEKQQEIQDKDIVESLENEVYYWTDFSKVQYHPRSLFELCTSWIDMEDFENYGSGNGILSEGMQGEEMNDRLRYFVEECDGIQGFQFIVDDSGGFSSIAVDFAEIIADDYSKTPLMIYTARSTVSFANVRNQMLSMNRALHDAVSFSQLANYSHLIVPVGLPSFGSSKLSDNLCIDDAKLFHSSAVFAASISCISLPFRMELPGPTSESKNVSGAVDMGELVHILTGQGWENMVAILDASMPVPSMSGNKSQEYLLESFHPLNHEVKDGMEDARAVESTVIQGALQSGHRASISEVRSAIHEAYRCRSLRPRFSHLSTSLSPLPIPLPFPSIFRSLVGGQGELLSSKDHSLQPHGPLEVESIPMGTRLRSSRAILPFIEKRLTDLQKFGIRRGAPGMQLLRSFGFSNIEVEEIGEALLKMVQTLDPKPDLSSDSD